MTGTPPGNTLEPNDARGRAGRRGDEIPKLIGFLLLLAGWIIVLASLALLPAAAVRTVFLLAGCAVQGVGLVLVIRSHSLSREEKG